MGKWADYANELERRLRLRTIPLAVKFLVTEEQVHQIPRVRILDGVDRLCRIVTTARTTGWTIGVTRSRLGDMCGSVVGFCQYPEERKPVREGIWFASKEDCEKFHGSLARVPLGYEALVLAPMLAEKFEPDVVLVWGTPTQIMMILCALQRIKYRRFRFFFCGESSCSDSLAECFNSGEPALSLPCYGERVWGHVSEDELELAIPPRYVGEAIDGLKLLWEAGNRYPIPSGADIVLDQVRMQRVYKGRLERFKRNI